MPDVANYGFYMIALHCMLWITGASGCSGPLGMISGEIEDWQISASSHYPESWDQGCHVKFSRVNGPNGKAWCARYKSSTEWLQIDLGVAAKITGVLIQGRGDDSEWVVSYMVSYSMDAYHWKFCNDLYGNHKLFDGNTDSYTIRHTYLEQPITARFIKFHIVHWHTHPSMRVEIIGCQECNKLIGFPPYVKITASSSWPWLKKSSCQPDDGHIFSSKAWCSRHNNGRTPSDMDHQWLQFDLGPPVMITGLVTKGREDTNKHQWVTSYKISYSNDSVIWYFYKDGNHLDPKEFGGSHDKSTERRHYLNHPFVARFVRFHPVSWKHHISMRAGILGCPHKGDCGPGFMRINEATSCIENLAYKKDTWLNDKRHRWKEWTYGHSSLAVDGNLDISLHLCAILDNYYVDTPIWMVDLGKETVVSGIIIRTWQGKSPDKNNTYRDYVFNLEKLITFVENKGRLESLSSAKKCASVTRLNNALFASNLHLECTQPLTGRYVYIEAWGVPNRWSRSFNAVLCEVMVY